MNMDEQQIIELYRAVNQAMVAKDIDKLDRILADGMHLVHMTGYDQTKDEWFAQNRSEQMRYYSTKRREHQGHQDRGQQSQLHRAKQSGCAHLWLKAHLETSSQKLF